MNTSDSELERWGKIAAELRAYREALHDAWGGVDDVVLANYLAGAATHEEILAVELAMREKPAVQELVDVVRESLQPAWILQAALAPAVESGAVKVLRESLRVWVDEAGRLISQGVEHLMRPSLAPALDMALGNETEYVPEGTRRTHEEACWRVPLEELGHELMIRAKSGPTAGQWLLNFELVGDVNQPRVEQARFKLARPNALPLIHADLSKFAGRFLEIDAGQWELTIQFEDIVRVVPMAVGLLPTEHN